MSNTKQLIKKSFCLEKIIDVMSAEIDKKIDFIFNY